MTRSKKTSGPTWGGREPDYWRDRTRQPHASPMPPRHDAEGKPMTGFMSRARKREPQE